MDIKIEIEYKEAQDTWAWVVYSEGEALERGEEDTIALAYKGIKEVLKEYALA